LISNCCAIPFVIIAGKTSDKLSAKITIPGALIFQITVMTLYCFVKFPTDWTAYALAVLQVATTMIVIVMTQSYVSKRTPKNVRGMTFAMIGILGSFGSVLYLQLEKILVQYGQFMAFGTVALIDFIWLIFLGSMILIGKFGQAPAGVGDEDEGED